MRQRNILFAALLCMLMQVLIACYSDVQAQTTHLQGSVRDAATGEPIAAAQVRVIGRMQGTITDAEGVFSLTFEGPGQTLEITHIGFKRVHYNFDRDLHKSIVIQMQPAEALAPVTITAGPQPILDDPTIHIYDYEWMDDQLVMIIYDRKLRRSKLAIVDEHDSIVATELLEEEPGKLVKDCLGNVHAITKHFACQLFMEGDQIGHFVDSLAVFEEAVLPCLGNIGSHYYLDHWAFNNQILDYRAYDMETGNWKDLLHVADKVRMHQLMDPLGPYVSIAPSEAAMYSLSEQDWDKIGKINAEFQFEQLAFFRPVDAPLRIIDGKVYVFDHLNGEILSYAPDCTPIANVAMDYHKLQGRERFIIVDEQRGEAYTVFEKHGYQSLRRIDLATGTLGTPIDIPRQFPQKIQIRDGIAYFMYLEGHYDEVKRLYRMPL